MKKVMIAVCSLGLLACGCTKPPPSDVLALQGNWSGKEADTRHIGSPTMVVQGTNLEVYEADTNIWYKANVVLDETKTPKQMLLLITDSPLSQYVGKRANAIYQLQDGALTITANEPGNPSMPANFTSADARTVVFKHP
jgi:uncharacterized protein (TIGR03067 family)